MMLMVKVVVIRTLITMIMVQKEVAKYADGDGDDGVDGEGDDGVGVDGEGDDGNGVDGDGDDDDGVDGEGDDDDSVDGDDGDGVTPLVTAIRGSPSPLSHLTGCCLDFF